MSACPHCATEISANARFCRSCGRSTGQQAPAADRAPAEHPGAPFHPGYAPPASGGGATSSTAFTPPTYPPAPSLPPTGSGYGTGAPVGWGGEQPPRRRSAPIVLLGIVPVALIVVAAAVFNNIQKHREELIAQWTTYEDCRDDTGPLRRSLERIDSGLSFGDGITFSEFDGYLESAHEEYGRVPPEQLGQVCVAASAVHLEAALNAYSSAYNDWLDCIQDYWCSDPDLQGYWSSAESDLLSAADGLETLRPDEPDPRDS